eukprot:2486863-Prymnesium_polylepis.1
MAIPSMCRQEDRLALMNYFLTGDVLVDPEDAPSVGSICMWAAQPGRGGPQATGGATGARIYDVIPISKLFQASDDVHSEAVRYLGTQVKHIRGLLGERLRLEFVCGEVTPSSPILELIKAWQPKTMSWSNIMDYINP